MYNQNLSQNPEWLTKHEEAETSVVYLFDSIRQDLNKRLGSEYGDKHPEIVAQLVNAAMIEISKK